LPTVVIHTLRGMGWISCVIVEKWSDTVR